MATFWQLLTFLVIASSANAAPQLVIDTGKGPTTYTEEQLSAMAGIRDITIPNDPAYNKAMTYRAIPVRALFSGVATDGDTIIEFRSLDGFSGSIDASRLLNPHPNGSHAYIAIETTSKPWPALKPGGTATAGPFYLIWEHPEKSHIVSEEWPFQLASLKVKGSLQEKYPKIFPKDQKYLSGFKVFRQNCFPCHTINRQGSGQIGPDLNYPHSPTEYMQKSFLPKLIRNSQAVRAFSNGKMPEFKDKDLSDSDLNKLIEYLSHMAMTRPKTKI